MKKSENLIPCLFDDKDIIVDDNLWQFFFDESSKHIPYCVADDSMSSAFFINCVPFLAEVENFVHNTIFVYPPYGKMSDKDMQLIKQMFMAWNNYDDSDIHVECETSITRTLTFTYYHTDI